VPTSYKQTPIENYWVNKNLVSCPWLIQRLLTTSAYKITRPSYLIRRASTACQKVLKIQKRVEEIEARLAQAHQKAVAELRTQQELFQKLITNVKTSIEQHATEAEAVAVEVAFASVIRLLGDKAADHTLVAALCAAVANEYGHGAATLHVSEADRVMFESVNIGIAIEVDRRLQSGQCIIETTRGQFDCGVDVRLEALKKAFLSGLNDHRGQM